MIYFVCFESCLFQVKKKDLSHLADSIQQEQAKLYQESRLAKNILQATFDATDKYTIKKIWKAVEFTEVIINPGRKRTVYNTSMCCTYSVMDWYSSCIHVICRSPSSSFEAVNADIHETSTNRYS